MPSRCLCSLPAVRSVLLLCVSLSIVAGFGARWWFSNSGALPRPHFLSFPSGNSPPSSLSTRPPYDHLTSEQLALAGAGDVVVAIKTGATELYDKLPVHFATTLTHLPKYLLFSDIDQTVGDFIIYDSLVDYNETMKNEHPDFGYYRRLQSYKHTLQDVKRLKLQGGWEMDKWKNIQMLSKTYKTYPNAKWYLFIDADTYVLWPNLLRWLGTLDYREPLYLGSPTDAVLPYAHGGSGYIISSRAMRVTAGNDSDIGNKYVAATEGDCCGDFVIGYAMKDHGIDVTDTRPMIQGEPTHGVRFTKEQWCDPVVTLHHMQPSDIESMWEFERKNATLGVRTMEIALSDDANSDTSFQRSILYVDVFERFVAPIIIEELDGWDNFSEDITYRTEKAYKAADHGNKSWKQLPEVERNAHRSFEDCKAACRALPDCLQFYHKEEQCNINRKIRLGWEVPDGNIKSGWMLGRIETMRRVVEPCLR